MTGNEMMYHKRRESAGAQAGVASRESQINISPRDEARAFAVKRLPVWRVRRC
jgi:hypothetical protein